MQLLRRHYEPRSQWRRLAVVENRQLLVWRSLLLLPWGQLLELCHLSTDLFKRRNCRLWNYFILPSKAEIEAIASACSFWNWLLTELFKPAVVTVQLMSCFHVCMLHWCIIAKHQNVGFVGVRFITEVSYFVLDGLGSLRNLDIRCGKCFAVAMPQLAIQTVAEYHCRNCRACVSAFRRLIATLIFTFNLENRTPKSFRCCSDISLPFYVL